MVSAHDKQGSMSPTSNLKITMADRQQIYGRPIPSPPHSRTPSEARDSLGM